MKSSVTLLLVALLFVGGIAFAQGIVVQPEKAEPEKKPEAPKKVEEDVEIELDLEDPDGEGEKKAARMISFSGDWDKIPPEMKEKILASLRKRFSEEEMKEVLKSLEASDGKAGKMGEAHVLLRGQSGKQGRFVVGKPVKKVVVVEEGGDADLGAVIEQLKQLRARVGGVRMRSFDGHPGQGARGGHGGCGCGRCAPPAPRPPACPHCGPRHGRPGGGHAGFDGGLRQSIDALRGEISGLRHEIRSMRGAHAPKASGTYHMSGTKGGPFGVAVKKAPASKHPAPPPKAVAVGKGGAGGVFIGRAPVKADPRQAKLEKEVADLRKETAHLKAMMAELLRKMDEMQKASKDK
ncbi:MAG: hypothetical protein ABFS86_11825 [Planctomycetota bacterium]